MLRFGQAMTSETRFAIKLALTGFWVAMALRTYTFYLNTHNIAAKQTTILFLMLCPCSLGSGALDNFSPLGAIIGWLGIAVGNAYLYVVVGRALRARIQSVR
jgi:succinate-acetate transporter protein